MKSLSDDVADVQSIPAVPSILDVICRTTGMGFAAVARVTEDRWIACSVLDKIQFGLLPGGELKVDTTICYEIRDTRQLVVIDHVAEDTVYCQHQTPRLYGFQSYISMPIVLPSGRFFGTLCAIDPRPARLNTPEVIGMFKLFAELIAFHLDAAEKLAHSESRLLAEREISELREQFIGVLGHDLRNPLGAISMGATLLAGTPLDAEQEPTVDMMKRSVARMSDLIDDALDFTRGRLGGGITLQTRADLPIEPVLRQVVDEVRARWPDRVVQAEFDLRESIRFDRQRMAQLFTNLLANAISHGWPSQPVSVSATSRDGFFYLAVANAADPIPPPVLERLFEPFSRGGSGNYQQGLGLGLYIASEIAKSHGGTLGVLSTVKETRFTFTMPTCGPFVEGSRPAVAGTLAPAALAFASEVPLPYGITIDQAPEPCAVAGNTLAGPASARVLLIEDHADTLSTLTRLLTRKGHTVTPAPSGAEARLEFALGTFDVIVSDLGLPDCSGLELIAEFCASCPTPAIAMSGYGLESDILSSKAAGFTEHLTKPIDFEQLMRSVDRLVHKVN